MTNSPAPFISCREGEPWCEEPAEAIRHLDAAMDDGPADLVLDGTRHQTWEGFGGCFNELGWHALSALDDAGRERVLADIFGARRFPMCRAPTGANDYALEWHSHNETPDDLEMRHFSIDRDRRTLLPYLRAALRHEPAVRLFASPWSPPAWLKRPRAFNHGTVIW